MQYNYYQPYQQYPQNYPQYQQPIQQYPVQNAYTPQIQPQTQQAVNLSQQAQNAIINPKFDVVQGELAANMYDVLNGQEVILIDRDNPYVYKRKRTPDGKLEPMEKFKLVKEEEQVNQGIDLKDFVRQEEIGAIIENAVKNEVEKKLSELTLKPTRKRGEE